MNTEMQVRIKSVLFVGIACAVVWYGARFFIKKQHHGHADYSAYKLDAIYDKENIIPVVVVGSGPAGLSAALYGARSGFHTVVFEGPKPGGQLMGTSFVENWPGLPKKMGPELISSLKAQGQEFGVVVVNDGIKSIDTKQWPYVLTTENGATLHALTVILATGASARMLGVPGEQEYFGWDKGVSTCAICDAPFYKGKEVYVVGGGDSAAEEAMQLAPYARKITVLVRGKAMRASAVMQDRLKTYPNVTVQYNSAITAYKGDGKRMTEVEMMVDGKPTKATLDGVFLAVGHDPNSSVAKGIVAMDDAGFILLKGRSQATSVPGIYAAGDVSDHKYRQAGIASGDGIKAGLDAVEFLRMVGFNDAASQKVEGNLFDAEGGPGRQALTPLKSMADFEKEVAASNLPILLDFYTESCPTCMQLLPTLEILAGEFAGKMKFFKVDLMEVQEFQAKYKIVGVPTVLVLKEGVDVARMQKPMPLKEMRTFLETALKDGKDGEK